MTSAIPDAAHAEPAPARRFDVSVRTLVLVPLTAALCFLLLRLLPVLLALLLVGTLNPAVRWLERHRIKRTWAVLGSERSSTRYPDVFSRARSGPLWRCPWPGVRIVARERGLLQLR